MVLREHHEIQRASDSYSMITSTGSILWVFKALVCILFYKLSFPGSLSSNWLAHVSEIPIHILASPQNSLQLCSLIFLQQPPPPYDTHILLEGVGLLLSTSCKHACQGREELKLMLPHSSFSFCSLSHSAVRVISPKYQAALLISIFLPQKMNVSPSLPGLLDHAVMSDCILTALVGLQDCLGPPFQMSCFACSLSSINISWAPTRYQTKSKAPVRNDFVLVYLSPIFQTHLFYSSH